MAVCPRTTLTSASFLFLLFCSYFAFYTPLYDGHERPLDLFSLTQDDPKLVDYVKQHFLIRSGKQGGQNFAINPPKVVGQYNQPLEVDKIYNSSLFNGFFIEVGAHDGETLSNSLLFELERGWTGLLIEANSERFQMLEGKNRDAWLTPVCLSTDTKPVFVEFVFNGINNKNQKSGKKTVEQKTCIPLYTLLLALGNPSVHYFSLDIEGAELKILKSIPWHLVDIWLVGIETNHVGAFDSTEKRSDLLSFMVNQGYKHIGTIGIDDIFIKADKIHVSEHTINHLKSLKIKAAFPNDPQKNVL